MALNPWTIFGLQSNPFFQETLSEGSSLFPLQLFVGRTTENRRLQEQIAGDVSSRNVIIGPPGIGKTTLAQYVKSQIRAEGYIANDDAISVTSDERAVSLLFRIISYIHEAVLRWRPALAGGEFMQTARDILRTSRLQGYQGGLQILGNGVQAGRESQITHPVDPGLLGEAWRLASQLVTEVCSNGAQGVVLHINNFENLSGDKEIQSTAHILRDLRDFFLTPHLHTIFVGTDDTLTTILTKYQQVRSILPFPEPLPALLPEDVTELIQRRYDYLQLPDREFIPPIEIKTAGYVYELFHGDLRGMLRSLEDAAVTLAGLGKDHPIEPIGFELITQLLQPMYIERFKSIVSEPLFKKFMILKELGLSMFTQTDLSDLWAVSIQRVSQLLPELERLGYIQSIGRDGRSRQYRLSGVGRLSLGLYGR